MPRSTLAFLQHTLAVSVAGPLLGMLLFFVIMPGMLAVFFLMPYMLPFALLVAYQFGLVPALLTSIVLFFARTRLERLPTVLVTAVAAATFGAIWAFWLLADLQDGNLLMPITVVSGAASFAFSVPKWDGRRPLG